MNVRSGEIGTGKLYGHIMVIVLTIESSQIRVVEDRRVVSFIEWVKVEALR